MESKFALIWRVAAPVLPTTNMIGVTQTVVDDVVNEPVYSVHPVVVFTFVVMVLVIEAPEALRSVNCV